MQDESRVAMLMEHPLFRRLSEEKLSALSASMKIRNCTRGEIYSYGEGNYHKICLLLGGRIKITTGDELGKEGIKDILTAPDIFGDLSLQGRPPANEYAVVLTTGTIIGSFAIQDFRRLLEDHPPMALDYANLMNRKLQQLEDRHCDLVFRDARHRLIGFIRRWASSDGNRIGDRIILSNYLTHSDIAGMISTSRQSVNVLFNELRDAGMLLYNRKRIELRDGKLWN